MKFSVIMPSRLQIYPNSARNKDGKLLRAINSVIGQTLEDWELHIIADGCRDTIDIVQNNVKDKRIHLWKITHTKLWSGRPRNTGIEQASGDWIIYLDNDDIYGENHLQIVNDGIANYDWIWYNDIRFNPRDNNWYENSCDIHTLGRHGTSNVAHRRNLGIFWDEDGKYAHDFHFVRKLLKIKNVGKISTPEYYVCHVPGSQNSGGYDL